MRKLIVQAAFAAFAASAASAARAHEFTCEEVAGIVQVDASGLPVIGWGALPVFRSDASSVFTLHEYPAIVGIRVALRNVAAETSVITGVTDAFTAGLTEGVDYARYGLDAIGPGFSLPPGATTYEELAIRVASQADCLKRFGAGTSGAPVCTDAGEDRFVVTHDAGSTECRARIVCGSPGVQPPPLAGPVPPPACPGAWGGVKQFGTSMRDGATGLALDAQCNVHVTGQVVPAPPTTLTSVLWSLAADGTSPARLELGTSGGNEYAAGVAVDGAGNRYVGWTHDSQGDKGFVTKLAPGGAILWTQRVVDGRISGIAADVAGDAYVVGATGTAMVLVKVGPDGTTLWTDTFYAAGGEMAGFSVALSPAGDVLVAGYGVPAPGARPDAYVAKLDPDDHLQWARFIGTAAEDKAFAVAGDAEGNVYVGGTTFGAFPGYATTPDFADAFVAKLDPEANLAWIRQLGAKAAAVWAVAVDAAANLWAVGATSSAVAGQTFHGGEADAFVAKFDAAGGTVFVNELGTAARDGASGVVLDANGDAFVSGFTDGDLGGVIGGQDAFVAKFDPLGNLQ